MPFELSSFPVSGFSRINVPHYTCFYLFVFRGSANVNGRGVKNEKNGRTSKTCHTLASSASTPHGLEQLNFFSFMFPPVDFCDLICKKAMPYDA